MREVRLALVVSLSHRFKFDEKGKRCVEKKRIVARLDPLDPDSHHWELLRLL